MRPAGSRGPLNADKTQTTRPAASPSAGVTVLKRQPGTVLGSEGSAQGPAHPSPGLPSGRTSVAVPQSRRPAAGTGPVRPARGRGRRLWPGSLRSGPDCPWAQASLWHCHPPPRRPSLSTLRRVHPAALSAGGDGSYRGSPHPESQSRTPETEPEVGRTAQDVPLRGWAGGHRGLRELMGSTSQPHSETPRGQHWAVPRAGGGRGTVRRPGGVPAKGGVSLRGVPKSSDGG